MYQYSSQGSYPPRHTPPKTPLYDKLHRCGVEPLAPNSGLTPVDHKLAKSTLVRMAENRDRRMRKPSLSMLELSAKGTPPPVAKFSTSITPGSCALNSRLSNTSSNNEFTFSPTASRSKSNGTAPWQTLRRKFTDKINLRRFQRSNAWDRWEQQLDDWVEKMQEDQNLSPSTEPASFYDRDWSRDPLPTATECRDFPCPESPMSIIDAKMYTCLSQDPNYQDAHPSFVGSLKKQSSKTLAVVNSPLSNSPSMDDLSTCKSESKVRPGSRPRLFSFDKGKYRIPTLTIQKKSLATSSWISPKPSAPVPPSEEPTLRSLPEPFRVFTSKPVDTKSGLAETIDPNVADSLDPISQNILPELLESMESFPGVDAASLTESESQYLSWTTYATDDLDEDLRQRFYNLVGEPLSQSHRTSLSQREEPPDGTKPCIVRRKMLTSERTFTDMKIHKASTAQSGHRLRLPLGGLKNQLVDRFKPKPKAVGKDNPVLAPQTMTPSVSAPCTPQHGVRHLEHSSKDRQCGAESPKLLNGAELIPLHEANAGRERLMQKVEMSKTSTTPVYPVPPRLDSSRPHSSCSTGGIRPLAPRLSKVNSQYTPYRVTAPRTTGSSGSSRLSIVSSEARTTPVAPPKSAYRLLRPATPQFATTENVNPGLVSAGTPRTPSMLIEGEPSIIQTPQLLTVQSGQAALVHTYSSSKCPSLTTSPDSRPISMAKNNSNPVQLGRRPVPSTPAYPQRSSGDGVPEMKHSATTQSTSVKKDDDELTGNQAGSRQAIPSGARIHTLVQSIAELILERTLNALQEEVMQSSNGARKEEPVLDKAHPGTNKEMAKASEELEAPFEKSISSDKNVETSQIPGLPSAAIEQLHKQAYRRSLQIVTNHLARRNQRSSTCMTLGDPSTVAPQTPTVTVNGGAKSRESLSRSTKAAESIQDNSVALNPSLPATATMGSSTSITPLSDPTSPTNSSTETLPHDHLVNRVNSIIATEASSPSADSGERVQRLRKSIRLSSIRHPVHHQPTSTFVVADTTAENSDSDDSDLDIAPSLGEFMRHYMKISPRPTSQSVAIPIAEYHKDLSKILRPSSVRNSTKVRQSLHGLQYVERTHQHHHNPNHQIYSDDDAPSFVSQTSTISGVSHAGIVIDIDKISQQHDSPATALP
ncbi:hypothetical protein IWQ62_003327 [Dispira parvispora]|uniref:Uncharacterized protein n=1 Tax=Dispira parvispora TaxID=1520584 RepID=A0A9W8E306_9FUNG|nr:hypothetical protein IWQ62_003327 [Dispira parvispora]